MLELVLYTHNIQHAIIIYTVGLGQEILFPLVFLPVYGDGYYYSVQLAAVFLLYDLHTISKSGYFKSYYVWGEKKNPYISPIHVHFPMYGSKNATNTEKYLLILLRIQ